MEHGTAAKPDVHEIDDGREVVTFRCGNHACGTAHMRWITGVIAMTVIKSKESADNNQGKGPEVEGEIREFVRRDVSTLRRTPEFDGELVASNISTLLQRVSGASLQEIDRLIAELQTLRDLLHSEGARMQREITEYAHLSQSAMQSTKIIAESLATWKQEGGASSARG